IGVLTRRRVHGRLAVRGHPEVPRTFEGLYGRAQITDPTGYRPRIMTIVSTGTDPAPAAVAWHLAGIAARSGLRTEVASGDTRMHEYLLAEQYAMSCSELGPLLLPTHTLQPPAGGILSTAGLTLALNAVTSNADLILIAAASPLIDANAHSQIRIADSVIATATPKPRTQTIAAVCDRIRQSSAGLIGVTVIDAGEPHTAHHDAHHRELDTLGVIRTRPSRSVANHVPDALRSPRAVRRSPSCTTRWKTMRMTRTRCVSVPSDSAGTCACYRGGACAVCRCANSWRHIEAGQPPVSLA